MAAVGQKKGGWTEADLTREINNACPDYLGGLIGAQVAGLLDGLTALGMEMVHI